MSASVQSKGRALRTAVGRPLAFLQCRPVFITFSLLAEVRAVLLIIFISFDITFCAWLRRKT